MPFSLSFLPFKVHGDKNVPAVTEFYARHCLWLLLVLLFWFVVSMVRVRSSRRPSGGWFWLVGGAVILLILLTYGALALAAVTSLPHYWNGGPPGR